MVIPRSLGFVVVAQLALACAPAPDDGTPCNVDDDCPLADVCELGFCTPRGTVERRDGGPERRDAGAPRVDAGSPRDDAGAVGADGGFDAGTPVSDAGWAVDAGATEVDAGTDAGRPPLDAGFDGGTPIVDAGYDAGPPAPPWLDDDAAYRAPIFVDNSALGGAVSNAPLPVRLPATFPYDVTDPGGSDLRFWVVGGEGAVASVVPHDIEEWSEGGESVAWVRVDVPAPPAVLELWLYFGGAGAPASGETVWPGHVAVYHLNDSLSVEPAVQTNAVNAALHPAAAVGVVSEANESSGPIAGALDMTGTGHFQTANSTDFRINDGQALTFETWFRLPSPTTNYRFFLWHEYGCRGWSFGHNNNGQVYVQHAERDVDCNDSVRVYRFSQTGLDDGEWHYGVGVVDRANAKLRLYVDGESRGESDAPGTPFTGSGRELRLAQDWTGDNAFVGGMDEARVSIGVRSPDYIRLQYEAVAGGAVTLGAVE